MDKISSRPGCDRPGGPSAGFLAVAILAAVLVCSPHARAAASELEFYDRLESLHGHTCGGSLMGARLGFAARRALQAAGGNGKRYATYFDHSCPVDGVQLAAGTTFGNRAIEVLDCDEQRLILSAANGPRVEARLTESALEKGKASRALSKRVRALPAAAAGRRQLESEIEAIFEWFRTAPEAEVVTVKILD